MIQEKVFQFFKYIYPNTKETKKAHFSKIKYRHILLQVWNVFMPPQYILQNLIFILGFEFKDTFLGTKSIQKHMGHKISHFHKNLRLKILHVMQI